MSTSNNEIIRHEDDGGVWYEDTETGRCWEYCASCGAEKGVSMPCRHCDESLQRRRRHDD